MQYQTHLWRGQPDTDAIKMIQEFEGLALEHDPRGYCVCTSEGKDSRVLGDLFRRAGVKHFYVHNITGIDPPELVYFQRRNFQAYRDLGYLTYDLPYRMSIWRMMQQKLIPPLRTKRFCCAELKERRHPIQQGCLMSFGVRKFESTRRAKQRNEIEIIGKKDRIVLSYDDAPNRQIVENCYAKAEKRINPIANWPDEYIWDYSKERKLEQCRLYEEGFHRLGCIGCPMAGSEGRKEEFARWPGFELLWRKSFDFMHQRRRELGKPVYQKSGAEWFERWLNDESMKDYEDEYQMLLEEDGE